MSGHYAIFQRHAIFWRLAHSPGMYQFLRSPYFKDMPILETRHVRKAYHSFW
jgi:hypothetical protein